MIFKAPRLATARLSLAAILAALPIVTIAVATLPASARPQIPAEKRYEPYTGQIPQCDDPAVLSRIQSTFAEKESTYWASTIELVAIERPRQVALRPWGIDHTPRRYCQATAITNEPAPPHRPRTRAVHYSVIEGGGFIGLGFGVEWCVNGLDRNLAYAPHCKAAGR
jgi:hypothetical protein